MIQVGHCLHINTDMPVLCLPPALVMRSASLFWSLTAFYLDLRFRDASARGASVEGLSPRCRGLYHHEHCCTSWYLQKCRKLDKDDCNVSCCMYCTSLPVAQCTAIHASGRVSVYEAAGTCAPSNSVLKAQDIPCWEVLHELDLCTA